jgi:hypothetical protein
MTKEWAEAEERGGMDLFERILVRAPAEDKSIAKGGMDAFIRSRS